MKRPHWPLERVKQLAAEGKVFLQRNRAIASFETPAKAYKVATKVLLELSENNFSETREQTYDIMDIYGVPCIPPPRRMTDSRSWE